MLSTNCKPKRTAAASAFLFTIAVLDNFYLWMLGVDRDLKAKIFDLGLETQVPGLSHATCGLGFALPGLGLNCTLWPA